MNTPLHPATSSCNIGESCSPANLPLRVADFNFTTTGTHAVASVTKTGFDSCTNSSFIGNLLTMGPAKIVLEAEGEMFDIPDEIPNSEDFFKEKLCILRYG
ncbi:hypothetical protein NE237_021219 [Protea cynaroides]|uniref:Uncharacterized protein n=1 Tax=Protea cynaroides TaxID=273540 RepID=A0A9Q0K2E4_9MAGN|nr:hypothetical protein NE237_021219 [Protea cynaroides]